MGCRPRLRVRRAGLTRRLLGKQPARQVVSANSANVRDHRPGMMGQHRHGLRSHLTLAFCQRQRFCVFARSMLARRIHSAVPGIAGARIARRPFIDFRARHWARPINPKA